MKTTLTSYYFDISKPAQLLDYEKLCLRMRTSNIDCFESHGQGSHYLAWAKGGIEIEIDTGHIFGNQWNTAPIPGHSEKGHRVFDFALDACLPNKNIKRGHYLEITDDMREIRRNTLTCGYCGHQEPAQKGNVFCDKCCGSEYLESDNYKLLRLLPAESTFNGDRTELSEAEKAHILPLIEAAAKEARDKRAVKLRQSIIDGHHKTVQNSAIERDGQLWLIDHGQSIDNWIYYKHTGRWCFGWRDPVREVPAIVCEFPFPFDIKRAS